MIEDYDFTNKVFYTVLNLDNDVSYTTTINLGGLSVLLEFGYNSKLQRRWMSARSTAGDILLKRTLLVLNTTYEFNINAEILGKKIIMLFDSWNPVSDDYDFFDWKDTCAIQFTHCDMQTELDSQEIMKEYLTEQLF